MSRPDPGPRIPGIPRAGDPASRAPGTTGVAERLARLRSRRVGVVSTAVLVVLALVLTWLATLAEGESVRKADLNDGGVWVTNAAQARFGRVNKPASQLDAAVAATTPQNTGLDIVQDGAAVLALTRATNQVTPVNVRSGTLVESAVLTLPAGAGAAPGSGPTGELPVDLRGGTAAVVEPTTGKLRVQRVDTARGIAALDKLQAVAPPVATVGAGAVVAVGVDGVAYAASAATGRLAVVRPDPAGGFEEPALVELGFTAESIQLTAVGSRWVVHDPAAGQLRADGVGGVVDLRQALAAAGVTGGGTSEAGGAAYALVQQPGPDAEGVLVTTAAGAAVVPFGGRDEATGRMVLPQGASGRVWLAPPVRLGRCVHASWASAAGAFYGRNCGEPVTTAVAVETPPEITRTDGVRLRVNRGQIVLNDLDSGRLWDVDSDAPVKIDDWSSVIPPPRAGAVNPNRTPDDSQLEQVRRPPEANPDELQVRPGRTSTLHVLDNDTDSQGAVLAIAPGDVSAPDVAGILVSASVDGQTISVSVPDTPAAPVIRFSYWVNNGTAGPEGRSTAQVTLTVVDEAVNSAPKLRPGQALIAQGSRVPVIRGGHVAVGVLADWRDDENDPLVVEALDPGSSVDGSGALALVAPQQPGNLEVRYRVDDGRGGRTEAKAQVLVLGDADRPVAPVAQADVVRAVQGKPVQIQPLGNDIPGADPTDPTARIRLAAAVRGPQQLLLDTNVETGVVTVTGSAPGSYLLTYAAQVGSAVGAGRFRVDVLAPPTEQAPPVAAPDAATVRDQAPTIADVLVNDYSPRSDVLVIQQVATRESWIRAWVIQGRWLRVQATTPLPPDLGERRGVVVYTISDGTRTAAGELSVVQKPSPPAAVVPTVVDDQATVRWGDVVTIAALDNDSMADGVPLKIQPSAVRVVSGGGQVYPTGTVLRYLPGSAPISTDQVVTLEYAAYPEGMPERAVTGRVAVTVTPPPTPTTPSLAPTARNFSASVTAGDAITLTVPTSGVDPDGDLVFVTGVVGEAGGPVNLRLGRVVSLGASSIRYEAYPLSSGTEVIRYVVSDRYGKTGEGLIRVGVVQPGAPQPPVAVADDVVAAPGRTVVVDALANDLVPRGADVVVEDPAKVNDPAVVAQFAKQPDSTFKVTAPEEGPSKVLVYGIDGGLFDPSRATLTVRGRSGWNNPPIAVDDVARATGGSTPAPSAPAGDSPAQQGGIPGGQSPTSVLVDVLANDRDIDGEGGEAAGAASGLEVVEVGEGARIEPGGIAVTFADYPRAVPYVVADADGAKAMALVYVPANGSDVPYVLPGTPVTMATDAQATVRLDQHVADPRGRVVKVTTPDSVSTSPAGNLTATVTSATEIVLQAGGGYVGPAALMLEVTDRTGPEDTEPRTAYVVIPVQIGPLTPLLRCPAWEVTVVAGAPQRTVDVPRLCSAWFPEGLDPASVEYAAAWDGPAPSVALGQTGDGGRQVTLSAAADAVHGTTGTVLVGVAGQSQRFPLRVRVLSLRTDASAPGAAEAPPPPPAVLRPARVEGLVAGRAQVVNLAQYLDSPFGTLSCAVLQTRVTSGAGVSGSARGCLLTVTAAPDARGATVLTVDVSDGPDRVTTGTVTVTVLSKPDPPAQVSASADRVIGGTARVSWAPPLYDGGLPVLEYVVASGGTQLRSCDASPCTIEGLQNGRPYSFTVSARNAAGLSAPGGPSAEVVPDTTAGPVVIGSISPDDRSLTVTWSPPANNGSAIAFYNIQVTSLSGGSGGGAFTAGGGAAAYTIGGLVNNDEYAIRISAVNGAGPGPYGPSRTGQSVGTPAPVAAPTLSYPAPSPRDESAVVRISWPETDPNGPPITTYTVWRLSGGGWSVIDTVSGNAANVATDVVPYDGRTVSYAVTALNGGGKESARVNQATFQAIGVPEVPRPPRVDTPEADKAMVVSFALGGSRTNGWGSVNYRTSAGVAGSLQCGGDADCTKSVRLPNGRVDNQTLQIQGCTVSGSCSDWSAPSNSFRPYGPTLAVTALNPTVGGPRGRYVVRFAWQITENGRPVTVSVSSPSGTCRVAADQESCELAPVGYATTVTVVVRPTAADSGPGPERTMSVRTPDKADPTLSLSAGALCIGAQCGAQNQQLCPPGKACYRIKVTSTLWDADQMSCTFTVTNGGQQIGGVATVATNTTDEVANAFGDPVQITARCRNTTTDESAQTTVTWRDAPEPPPPPPPPPNP